MRKRSFVSQASYTKDNLWQAYVVTWCLKTGFYGKPVSIWSKPPRLKNEFLQSYKIILQFTMHILYPDKVFANNLATFWQFCFVGQKSKHEYFGMTSWTRTLRWSGSFMDSVGSDDWNNKTESCKRNILLVIKTYSGKRLGVTGEILLVWCTLKRSDVP
jgi:hypothetical protein